jgi:hypothetical protein
MKLASLTTSCQLDPPDLMMASPSVTRSLRVHETRESVWLVNADPEEVKPGALTHRLSNQPPL